MPYSMHSHISSEMEMQYMKKTEKKNESAIHLHKKTLTWTQTCNPAVQAIPTRTVQLIAWGLDPSTASHPLHKFDK